MPAMCRSVWSSGSGDATLSSGGLKRPLERKMADLTRFRGCLLGLAVGDAVGTTVEFCPRGTFAPMVDMIGGGGPFGLAPGEWTDDTSMALCLGTSLVERGTFDPRDQMERYWRWRDDGYQSSTGRCFDIGATVASALSCWCV